MYTFRRKKWETPSPTSLPTTPWNCKEQWNLTIRMDGEHCSASCAAARVDVIYFAYLMNMDWLLNENDFHLFYAWRFDGRGFTQEPHRTLHIAECEHLRIRWKSAAELCDTTNSTSTHSVVSPVTYVPNNLRCESADFARSSLRYNKPFNSCNTTVPYTVICITSTRRQGQKVNCRSDCQCAVAAGLAGEGPARSTSCVS